MRFALPNLYFPSRLLAVRLVLGLLLLAGALSGGLAFSSQSDDLAAYEQKLFSHVYLNEPLSDRLERLETSVFGQAQGGSESERRTRLLNVLRQAQEVIPTAPEPEQSAQGQQPGAGISTYNPAQAQQQPRRLPDATDYPTVTALEREVFGRDFIREDISHRLSRLEKKVFGQPYPQAALVDRVDKLLARYPGVKPVLPGYGDSNAVSPAIRDLPSDSSQFVASSRDVYTKVDALERRLLDGKTYPNKLLTERLEQLELQRFGHAYQGQSIDTRVNRLMQGFQVNTANSSGYQARPTVQSRPAYQPPPGQTGGMATGMPGYASSYSSSSTTSSGLSGAGTTSRQNVQLGAGFSQNSSYRFSNEMMEMLPPDVRAQLGGQTQSSGTGTVVTAPGTVTIERSTTYPGFQPYGGAPIQYYNYYGPPAHPSQQQTTTTVIQPDGSTVVYGYPGQNRPAGVPNPAYVGDPSFLQAVGNLEVNVFGQVNMMEPIYIRLGKLETTLLGQVYPGIPETQRLATLQRAYQYQSVGRLLGKGKGGDIGRAAGSALLGIPLASPPGVTLPAP